MNAVRMRFGCGANAVRMRSECGANAERIRCCSANAELQCECGAAVGMLCAKAGEGEAGEDEAGDGRQRPPKAGEVEYVSSKAIVLFIPC